MSDSVLLVLSVCAVSLYLRRVPVWSPNALPMHAGPAIWQAERRHTGAAAASGGRPSQAAAVVV